MNNLALRWHNDTMLAVCESETYRYTPSHRVPHIKARRLGRDVDLRTSDFFDRGWENGGIFVAGSRGLVYLFVGVLESLCIERKYWKLRF